MKAAKVRADCRTLELRHENLLRQDAKLAQDSQQLISDANRLFGHSA